MHVEQVVELARGIAAVDTTCDAALRGGLGDVGRLLAWCHDRQAAFAACVAERSPSGELAVAEAGRLGWREAGGAVVRAETAAAVPSFGAAFGEGHVSAAHVDVLTRGLRQLDSDGRAALAGQGARLALIAQHVSADEFAKSVRAEVRRLTRDEDAEARLVRQKRATRLTTWIDKDIGMGRWAGFFDPETALRLESVLDAQVEACFHDRAPEHCPADPIDKQAFLRAHALVQLIEGGGTSMARPEVVVVVDARVAPGEKPVVDWGIPVEVPDRVLADLVGRADVHVVVVRNGVVLHAPGQHDLGRSTRLASAAQRRILRGLYPTCAIPGCSARFAVCKVHHIRWWEHGGGTDLANLLPLCSVHHHKVHDEGWGLVLDERRRLTVTLPDGTTMINGPPRRS